MGRTRPLVYYKQGVNPWVTYINGQIYRKNNCINGVFTGKPGSGKSWAMLSIAEMLDPDFELQGNFFFNAKPLFKEIQRFYDVTPRYKWKGKKWLYDEAGIDLYSMKFFDEVNKGFNAFFQTARHRNYVFLCTVPYFNFLSKPVRKLLTAEFKADGWTSDNYTKINPVIIEYNGNLDKFYSKQLIMKNPDGSYCYIQEIQLPRPSKRIRLEYEKIKREFTSKLYKNVYEDITFADDKKDEQKNRLSYREKILLRSIKKKLSPQAISDETGFSGIVISKMINKLIDKEIHIKPVLGKGGNYRNRKIDHYEFCGKPPPDLPL